MATPALSVATQCRQMVMPSSGHKYEVKSEVLRMKNDVGILASRVVSGYVGHMKEVKVVHPLFYVRQKDGGLKMQAVWAKSCRGAMVRYILTNRISNPEDLKAFSYEGFEYNPNIGEEQYPHFVRENLK